MITQNRVGPGVAIRDLGFAPVTRLEFEFKIGAYNATGGNHIAVGIGNLYPFYDFGLPPQGSGFVIGEWHRCPDMGVIVAIEHYAAGYGVDTSTCYGPLSPLKVYKVDLKVTKPFTVSYAIYDGTLLLASFERKMPLVPIAPYPTGAFVIPVDTGIASGAYELLKFKTYTEK